jgi:hypothetical protein
MRVWEKWLAKRGYVKNKTMDEWIAMHGYVLNKSLDGLHGRYCHECKAVTEHRLFHLWHKYDLRFTDFGDKLPEICTVVQSICQECGNEGHETVFSRSTLPVDDARLEVFKQTFQEMKKQWKKLRSIQNGTWQGDDE